MCIFPERSNLSDLTVDVGKKVQRNRSGSAFLSMMLFSVGFYALLSFQLARSMQVDAYGLSATRIDILGYWLCIPLSFVVGVRLLKKRRLQLVPFYLIMLLIFYTSLIMVATAPSSDVIGYFISRHGVMLWFVIGIGVGGIVDVFRDSRTTRSGKTARWSFIVVSFAAAASYVPFALVYLSFPVPTIYYQSVSNNAAVLMIVAIFCIEALWGPQKPFFVTTFYLVLGSILAAAIIRMQSMSIAALWLGLIVVFFWQHYWNSRLLSKVMLVSLVIGSIAYFSQTQAFVDIAENTRFSELESGSLGTGFSSLTSRLQIMKSFDDQFSVSPIWGNFQAEIIAGAGAGYFVHSIPLSFLTHTGIVGFTLFTLSLIFLFRRRVFRHRNVDASEQQFGRVMMVVLVLGTISTFMTWSVLWFMMGFLCVKPSAPLRLKFQVQHPEPVGRRMLRWTDDASISAARNVA